MKCGIRHNVVRIAGNDSRKGTIEEAIKLLSEAGFETIDLGLGNLADQDYILFQDDWERKADELGNVAAKYGVNFCQLHVPFQQKGSEETDLRFRTPGFKEKFELAMERSFIIGGVLNIPWAVAHCLSPVDYGGDAEVAAKANHEYFDKYVELSIKNNMGVAFENMIQSGENGPKIRYTAHYQELIDYVDSYNDPMVQICWDFGHANVTGFDQCTALRKVGSRLKCVHIDDNFGNRDHHLLPFTGQIDWYKIMPVMAEIGYEGACNLETAPHFAHAPREIHPTIAKHAFEVCDYLRKLMTDAKAAL